MSTKKVAIIGTVGLPACYGGFETLVAQLAKHLHQEHELTVYCSGKRYPKPQRQRHHAGARLVYLPLDANGVQSIFYDCLSILHALFYADVLLVLGVPGGILLPFVKVFTRKRIIVSFDGIEWRRSKWNRLAKWYLRFAETLAVKYSHTAISGNDAIQNYTARTYSTSSRVIEYGGDHAVRQPITPAHNARYPFLSSPYAFAMCRIEPENNVAMILEAFAELPQHPLVLVGNWASSAFGQQLKAQYGGLRHLHLLDPIYDQAELDVLRGHCQVYIHGHSAGGTNLALVEAMYLGLSIAAFGVSFNRATTEHKARYFASQDELKALLKETSLATWHALSLQMQAIAERRFKWEIIAHKYSSLFRNPSGLRRKSGLRAQISLLAPEDLLQHELGHFAALNMFYEEEL